MTGSRWAALPLAAWLAVACEVPPPAAAPDNDTPARAIVTLSPHLAELVFAAGAGERLVGTVEFSDYPAAALQVPRVGDAFRVDYEAILGLRPDLILAWRSGNPPETTRRLKQLGYRVRTLEPERLEDIAAHLEDIGRLAGTQAVAGPAANRFRQRLAELRRHFRGAEPVRVFVQLSARPYFTVTDRHFLGQGMAVCGGANVFGDLTGLTASVSTEAILAAAPDAIIASDMGGQSAEEAGLAAWGEWPQLPAARAGNLFLLDADLLSRPGPRVLDGIERLCAVLDEARGRKAASSPAAR